MDMSSVESVVEAIRSGTSVGIRGHGSRDIPSSDTRPESWVEAPSGVVDFQPDEMIVRVRAGTTIAELDSALAIDGQFVHGADSGRGTIGGVLACGRSGLHRLGRGSIRDVVLEVRFIDHQGNLVKAGGPTVKNVSGFDLGRLFVGSFGVLGFAHEFVLRTRPRPPAERWHVAQVSDPHEVAEIQRSFYRPSSILWDGRQLHLCLTGHPADIDEQIARSRFGWQPVDPPVLPEGWRQSTIAPSAIASFITSEPERAIAQVGTGTIHHPGPSAARPGGPERRGIVTRLLTEFNPRGLLNPHIDTDAL
ncbi:MAG: FAD-binding protein [Actinomycetota bacterium]